MDDRELLEHFHADGDNRWLGILLERYAMLLMGVCMKYLKEEEAAKDAVQQVCMKVIAEIPKYRVEYFKSWLYAIAKNHCLMALRSPARNMTEIPENRLSNLGDMEEQARRADLESSLMALEKAIAGLNAEQRTCIELFYLGKKSYKEISAATGMGVNEVKSHIQNGKRNLRLIIERNQQDGK